jgi:hypothetical protein
MSALSFTVRLRLASWHHAFRCIASRLSRASDARTSPIQPVIEHDRELMPDLAPSDPAELPTPSLERLAGGVSLGL